MHFDSVFRSTKVLALAGIVLAGFGATAALAACGSSSSNGSGASADAGVDAGPVDTAYGDRGLASFPKSLIDVRVIEGADGRVSLIGQLDGAGDDPVVAVVRLLPDGTADDTFTTWSEKQVVSSARVDFTGACVDEQGRVIVMTAVSNNSINDAALDGVVLKRIDASGKLDTSFGSNGQVRLTGITSSDLRCRGGSIEVLGGGSNASGQGDSMVRWTLTADGHAGTNAPSLKIPGYGEPKFDSADGIITLDDASTSWALHHYDGAGNPDSSFGDSGGAVVSVPADKTAGIQRIDETTGNIVVNVTTTLGDRLDFYSKTGALLGQYDHANYVSGVVFDSKGRAVAWSGISGPDTSRGFTLHRYGPDGQPDTAWGLRRFDFDFFQARNLTLTGATPRMLAVSRDDHMLMLVELVGHDAQSQANVTGSYLLRLNP
ncbi:MAG: hypothetical protein JWO86_6887 [Myxococcaceae bacterium]|nr:hypothetical protein [Myxococcaceae bacterium]